MTKVLSICLSVSKIPILHKSISFLLCFLNEMTSWYMLLFIYTICYTISLINPIKHLSYHRGIIDSSMRLLAAVIVTSQTCQTSKIWPSEVILSSDMRALMKGTLIKGTPITGIKRNSLSQMYTAHLTLNTMHLAASIYLLNFHKISHTILKFSSHWNDISNHIYHIFL